MQSKLEKMSEQGQGEVLQEIAKVVLNTSNIIYIYFM